MAKSRATSRRAVNIWPGFVDALSTLVWCLSRLIDFCHRPASPHHCLDGTEQSRNALISGSVSSRRYRDAQQSKERLGSAVERLEERLQNNNDQLENTRDELALIRIRNDELLEQLGQTNSARRSLQEERSDNRALITDLRRQVTNLSGLSTTQQSEIDQLNRRNTELLAMLGQSEESDRARAQAVRELTATRQNLESQIATNESLMLDINARLATLLQSYNDLANDDNEIALLLSEDNLRNNLTSGVSATSALMGVLPSLWKPPKQRLETLLVARDEAEGRLQEAQALAIENRAALDQRTSALNSTIGRLNSTQAALESAQAQADQSQAALTQRALDLDQTLGRLSSVQEALDAAQAELEATGQDSAATIANLRTEMANAIAVRESQLDAASAEIAARNRQLRDAAGQIAAQEDKLLTATAEINAFKEQLFGASTEIAELMVAAEQSAAELTRVQAERDAVSSDLINAYERISASEAEVSMLAAELDNFARLRRILEEQIASLRAERTTLTGDLDALRDLTAQLQSDLTTTQQAFSELTDGASVLEAANSAIEQQLSEAFDRLTEVEKERDLAIVLAEEIQLLREQDGIALIDAETRIEAVESRLAQVLSNMDTITQKSQSEQRQLISQAQEIQVLETQLTNAEVSLALAERAQAEAEEKRRIAEESARIAAENLALEQQVDELEEFRSEFKGFYRVPCPVSSPSNKKGIASHYLVKSLLRRI